MISPLAQDFNFNKLIKYTMPSILMMLFMSTYTIVDGIFVSTYVGENALAAINLISPIFSFIMAIGLMFATGANAIIGNLLGQNKKVEANSFLSAIYIIGIVLGLLATFLIYFNIDNILNMLGTSDILYQFAYDYLISIIPFFVPLLLMVFVQSFLVTAGKPTLGFIVCVIGGLSNIVLDYLLIAPTIFDLGIQGAGIATGIGYFIPGIFGLLYFIFKRKNILHFIKPNFNLKMIIQSMYNGLSELIGALSASITTIMFNYMLMNIAGESGVAAISVIVYIMQFQTAIYNGFSIGISPIISFKYGEKNTISLKKVIYQGFKFIGVISFIIIVLSSIFADEAVGIFIAKNSETFDLAKNGLFLFTISYLFMGFNIYLSAVFTALSNGFVSGTISGLRSLVFIVISLLILPQVMGLNGIWLAIPFAEFLALLVAMYFYRKNKDRYQY